MLDLRGRPGGDPRQQLLRGTAPLLRGQSEREWLEHARGKSDIFSLVVPAFRLLSCSWWSFATPGRQGFRTAESDENNPLLRIGLVARDTIFFSNSHYYTHFGIRSLEILCNRHVSLFGGTCVDTRIYVAFVTSLRRDVSGAIYPMSE